MWGLFFCLVCFVFAWTPFLQLCNLGIPFSYLHAHKWVNTHAFPVCFKFLQPHPAVSHLPLQVCAAQGVSIHIWWAVARQLSGKHSHTSSPDKTVPNLACFLRGTILFSCGFKRTHGENANEKERQRPVYVFIEASRIYCTPL